MTYNMLVTFASKYGSTEGIADAIGAALSERGIDVHVLPIEQVANPVEYDAIVLGSAVYAGHWMKEAREFVDQHREALASRPVWLFSSGPVGDPPKPEENPVNINEIVAALDPVDHHIFAGKIDRDKMNFAEKALTMALRVPEGDYRNWDDIKNWSATIVEDLSIRAS